MLYTIEFYPEEGKYHYSGHRNCNVTMTPEEQRVSGGMCPVCKRKVTDGVMRRVQELADENSRGEVKLTDKKLKWYTDPQGKHPPFVKIVPLNEIIAEAVGTQVTSMKVKNAYNSLTKTVGSEFDILLKIPIEDITNLARSVTSGNDDAKIAEGIQKVREGNIVIQPGYDGVYGKVKIWHGPLDGSKGTKETEETKEDKTQLGIEFS